MSQQSVSGVYSVLNNSIFCIVVIRLRRQATSLQIFLLSGKRNLITSPNVNISTFLTCAYSTECSQIQMSVSPPQLHLLLKILYSWVSPPSVPFDLPRSLPPTASPTKCKRASQVLMNYLRIPIFLNPKPFQVCIESVLFKNKTLHVGLKSSSIK